MPRPNVEEKSTPETAFHNQARMDERFLATCDRRAMSPL